MKITIESTEQIVYLNGVPARVWVGATESGIECHALITRIAVSKEADTSQFERELLEQAAPRRELADAYPMRMVL